eukprot:TRINITY_DN8170_c0_g1_i1.p1 TRINITY_DN8170_c0_g1~~TRINITY_DN8170_c0_g1_i1.p1  ORF type:complete len:368 (-),score=70.26 TRINITY_DN8170_c0_g1_i1:424-1527(-)
MAKQIAKMFSVKGGAINWYPGHMAVATRVIRDRLKLADMVIEVRDARIPMASAHADLQEILSKKRRIIVLNKKDLANPNVINNWTRHFLAQKQSCVSANSHSRSDIRELLSRVEIKLKDAILKQPTLLVMVIGIPNVGKSVLINSVYQISRMRFPVLEKSKRATVGPLPGVTRDISGFKIAEQPSIYVLDTPGILVPNISDIETGLKLALIGSVKDSVVGEERLARYLLALLNTRHVPMQWRHVHNDIQKDSVEDLASKCQKSTSVKTKQQPRKNMQDAEHKEEQAVEAQRAIFRTFSAFGGDLENVDDLGQLIEIQLGALQRAFKIPPNTGEVGRYKVSTRLLHLFREGRLGRYVFDTLPQVCTTT